MEKILGFPNPKTNIKVTKRIHIVLWFSIPFEVIPTFPSSKKNNFNTKIINLYMCV